MAKPLLTISVGDYDRTRALIDGTVTVEGVDAVVLPSTDPGDMFHRMLRYGEFDASEMSMASHLVATEKGLPFVGIPVFPRRVFRHSSIYVNAEAGIKEPMDLESRRVGISLWQNTAAVWIKGILQHYHGVSLEKIRWVAEEPEDFRVETRPPGGIDLKTMPSGRSMEQMLLEGELDAVFAPRPPKALVQGNPKIKRLFPDYREVEKKYYEETKIFPIHHTVAVKRQVWEKYPWVVVSLLKAFREAKQRCFELRYWPGRYSMAWTNAWLDEERKLLGPDPWPYDLGETNRRNLEALIQYALEQGVIKTPLSVESLFAPNSLEA